MAVKASTPFESINNTGSSSNGTITVIVILEPLDTCKGGCNMNDVKAAEMFPVGEFLVDELEERGWTQADFAAILGRCF